MNVAAVVHLYFSREDDCSHIFATCQLDSAITVPSSVVHTCAFCKKTHTFYNQSSYLVSTPSQMQTFYSFAEKIGVVERDVNLDS